MFGVWEGRFWSSCLLVLLEASSPFACLSFQQHHSGPAEVELWLGVCPESKSSVLKIKKFVLSPLIRFPQHGWGSRRVLDGVMIPFSPWNKTHVEKRGRPVFFVQLSMSLCWLPSSLELVYPSCLLWCHVLATSKKSRFHRVILGFGLGPGFDWEDLKSWYYSSGFPSSSSSAPAAAGPKPDLVLLCCPAENMNYTVWHGKSRESQMTACCNSFQPQHTPFLISLLLFLYFF